MLYFLKSLKCLKSASKSAVFTQKHTHTHMVSLAQALHSLHVVHRRIIHCAVYHQQSYIALHLLDRSSVQGSTGSLKKRLKICQGFLIGSNLFSYKTLRERGVCSTRMTGNGFSLAELTCSTVCPSFAGCWTSKEFLCVKLKR